jgi:hypothetical protein
MRMKWIGHSADENEGSPRPGNAEAIVLASGNLGLISLMEEPRRRYLEEIEARHPNLIETLTASTTPSSSKGARSRS